ncbi:sigma-70 family RNA polymerase sigma factor [Halobacillus locisalis]|uniref:Sigma-70 family RNA polymerase sigma factor n=1 Tax=Halobacillus locisalis TaxID=220753 RepID=A0A838CRX6_9BACI|nr:sigma-70 family RNA polymerase sigma factor [Halobacillus locisalis]MBA2174701.1 sigma-70 family RNA polymerase sigma factor [Halobacillus locisalis]
MDRLTEWFYEAFPDLKGNRAVESFIQKSEHRQLIERYLTNPDEHRQEQLDQAFKAHYFDMRFTSYLSTSLYFQSINYDKRARRFEDRNVLTLDQSIGDGEGTTHKDQLVNQHERHHEEGGQGLESYIQDVRLLEAYRILTIKQQQIMDLAYVHQWSDTEIAKKMGVSQQAVSKNHRKALEKMKYILAKGDG